MVLINSLWETKVLPSVTSQRSGIALWICGREGLLEKQEGMPWVEGAHRPPESIRCSDSTLTSWIAPHQASLSFTLLELAQIRVH